MSANPIYDLGGVAINTTAANAIKGGFSHEVKIDPYDSIAPIKIGTRSPDVPNVIGVQFGRFRVLGSTGRKAGKGGATWVVRCSCGTYSVRTTKAIRNPKNSKDACGRCRHIAFVKASYVFHKTGKNVCGVDFL